MPKYRVETNQGTFEIEADTEPTPQDVADFLAARRQRVTESPGESIQRGPREGGMTLGQAVDVGLEAGLPMAGQALTSPAAPTGLTSAVGSGLSILGNALAQGRRIMMGEQEGFSAGQTAQAGLTGAVPFIGPAKAGAGVIRTAANVGKNMALQAGVGAAGAAARSGIDSGALPSRREVFLGTTIPALFGAVGSSAANVGSRRLARSRRIMENTEVFGDAGISPTPGMLLPEELGGIEQRMATKKPEIAGRIDETRQQVSAAFSPTATEGAEIFSELKPLLGQVSSASDEISKLSEAAVTAKKAAGEKFRALREAEKAQQADVTKAVREDAQKAMEAEWDANLSSVLDNARELVTARAAGGSLATVDPATFRNIATEHVAFPLRAAFKERADQMFSLVPNDIKGFDPKPILSKVDEITKTASGRLPTDLQNAVNDLRAILGDGDAVSLVDLRRARDQLRGRVDTGQPISSDEHRLINGITDEIRTQIDAQAAKVYGEEGATALRAANKYYAETRPLFDKPGVKVLFSTDPADEYVGKVIRGIEASGVNSDEYKNVLGLVAEIKKTHPEQATAIEELFKKNLHDSILHQSSSIDPQSGQYVVDGAKLSKHLESMGKVDGTLEALGFGNRDQVAELQRLFGDYPDAAKLTDQQWNALLTSKAFQAASNGRELKPLLEPFLAASAADSQLVRSAALFKAGKVADARRVYTEARDTLKKVNGDLGALQARHEMLLRDPVAVALDNPNLPDSSYDAFAQAFFSPSPSKVTNQELSGIVTAMEGGSRNVRLTLDRLRERYIADQIAQFKTTPHSSRVAQEIDPEKVRKFFEPANPSDAANEINRARVLLKPEQMDRLDDLAGVIRELDVYERTFPNAANIPIDSLPLFFRTRKALQGMADLWRAHNYNALAKAITNPREFARAQQASGEAMIQAGQLRATAGEGVSRAMQADTADRN